MTICQPAFQNRGAEASPYDALLSLATKCAIQADGTDRRQPSVSYPPEESNPKRLTSSHDAPLRRRLLLTQTREMHGTLSQPIDRLLACPSGSEPGLGSQHILVTPCQYGKQASTMAADRLNSRSLQLECAGPSYGLRVDTNLRSMLWYQLTTKGRTHVSLSLMCRLVCLRCQQLNLALVSGSCRLLVSSLVASLAGSALKPRNTMMSFALSRVLSRVSRVG